MPAPDLDAELTVALAEYTHINELRNQIDQKSSARFQFLLALATAVTAVASTLLVQHFDDAATVGAVAALGLMTLVFGYAIFLRQVAFAAYSARLAASGNAIRTYLAGRAPGLRPYLFLPVGADRGVFPARSAPFGGFAGAIGILNSAILALLVGLSVGWADFGAAAVLSAAAVFAVSLAAHLAYVRRSRTASARAIAAFQHERGVV